MSTLRYNEWLGKVSSNVFNVQNVNLNVKLVADDYIPSEEDTPADVDKYIINGVSAIIDDFFCTNGMSNIIDEVKSKMLLGFQMFPYEIGIEIDRVFTDKEQAEKLKQIIQMPENNHQLWKDLKENGVGYFVFESPEHDSLCFCENIEM